MPGPKVRPETLAALSKLAKAGKSATEILEKLDGQISLRTIYRHLDEMGLVKKRETPDQRMKPEQSAKFEEFVVKHSATLHPEEIASLWNEGPGKKWPDVKATATNVKARQTKRKCKLSAKKLAALPYSIAKAKEKKEKLRRKAEEREAAAKAAYRNELRALRAKRFKQSPQCKCLKCPECKESWPLTVEFFPHRGRKHLELVTERCLACTKEQGLTRRFSKDERKQFVAFLRELAKSKHPEEIVTLWNESRGPKLGAPPVTRNIVEIWLTRNRLRLSTKALAALPYSQALAQKAAASQAEKLREQSRARRKRLRNQRIAKRNELLSSGKISQSDLVVCGRCNELWPDTDEYFVVQKYRSRITGELRTTHAHFACRLCQSERSSEMHAIDPHWKTVETLLEYSLLSLKQQKRLVLPRRRAEITAISTCASLFGNSRQSLKSSNTLRAARSSGRKSTGVSSVQTVCSLFLVSANALARIESEPLLRNKQRRNRQSTDDPAMQTVVKLYRVSAEALRRTVKVTSGHPRMPRKSTDHSAIVAVGKLCCISTISLSRAEPRKAVKAPRAKARLRKNHSKQRSQSQLFKTVSLLWQSSAKALNKPERALIRRRRASTHEPQSDTKFVRCIELLFQSSTSSLYKPERVKKGRASKAAKKRDDTALRQTVVQLFSYSSKALSRSEAKPKVAKVRPDYQSGRCVFCGRKSKRLLLPEGRESRGYHCPKCTIKMLAMTDERLALLDLAMARLREAAKQRKELARQKREENARKNASKTPWRTSKYDDDVELEDLGEQGFSWDRDKRYRTDDDF